MLTNRPRSFQNTLVTETGLSDHHLMISSFLKAHLVRLKPKIISYRSYKKFDEKSFLTDVQKANFEFDPRNPDRNYENLTKTFGEIVNKHAPLKQKVLRGNEAPFMNRKFKRAIYKRSFLKNKWNKNPTGENKTSWKKTKELLCKSP